MFNNPYKYQRNYKKYHKGDVELTDYFYSVLERTENNVVPTPGLVWR